MGFIKEEKDRGFYGTRPIEIDVSAMWLRVKRPHMRNKVYEILSH